MKYIPFDKIKTLREAARNGDESARKILKMQLDGTEDFTEMLDGYFAPKPEVKEEVKVETEVTGTGEKEDERLQKFLSDNGITKDSPEYNEAVKEFYAEVGGENKEQEVNEFEELIKKLMKEESDAIDSYSKGITAIMNDANVPEEKKHRIIARFKEIRSDEETHYRELGELLKTDEE